VGDHELFFFAKVLEVLVSALFPPIDPKDPELYVMIDRLMTRRF
jgi:hypothetical protein